MPGLWNLFLHSTNICWTSGCHKKLHFFLIIICLSKTNKNKQKIITIHPKPRKILVKTMTIVLRSVEEGCEGGMAGQNVAFHWCACLYLLLCVFGIEWKKEKLIQLNLYKIKNNYKSKLLPPKWQNRNDVLSSLGHLYGILVIPNMVSHSHTVLCPSQYF